MKQWRREPRDAQISRIFFKTGPKNMPVLQLKLTPELSISYTNNFIQTSEIRNQISISQQMLFYKYRQPTTLKDKKQIGKRKKRLTKEKFNKSRSNSSLENNKKVDFSQPHLFFLPVEFQALFNFLIKTSRESNLLVD